jgi:hypothetical protein
MRMRSFFLLLFVLCSCARPVYWKPGATDAALQSDEAECQAEAFARAPPLVEQPMPPSNGFFGGMATYMNTPPFDENQAARETFLDSCLEKRGWIRQ